NFKAICNKSVLFPIPGSPPKSVSEPATNPPPKSLLRSSSVVSSRTSWLASISSIRKGCGEVVTIAREAVHDGFSSFCLTSSTIVFHSLQALLCPCHLKYCTPQFLLKKEVFTLDIIDL